MTPAIPDWLLELRSQHRSGVDAIALFRGVEPSGVIEAIRDCEIRILPAGAILLQPGEANDTIYVLLSGQLAAYLDNARLPDTGIPIRPGESVGEMSAIDGQPVSAFVVALTEARVLNLPGTLFWSRLGPIPGVTRNLLAALSERMRRSNEAMLEGQRMQLALEQVRRELQIARQLQTSMIPVRGRLFPERGDIEVAGMMNPASEVGGDFFDAFFVDERHLFFCVGDVSGHGIAAALFMARTIGLVRVAAMGARNPDRLLEHINERLCAGNDANMFVTLFCAFLDVKSGRLVYANAGHCAPLVAHAGRASLVPMPKGALVGVIPGAGYAASEMQLQEGVALVCVTDGVLEAESAAGYEFSLERLLSVSAASSARSVEDLLQSVQRELATFLDDRPPADDCTVLAIRRCHGVRSTRDSII
jgi:sigma-B regulation protein RsbU (phosphoserine phosphatase)